MGWVVCATKLCMYLEQLLNLGDCIIKNQSNLNLSPVDGGAGGGGSRTDPPLIAM